LCLVPHYSVVDELHKRDDCSKQDPRDLGGDIRKALAAGILLSEQWIEEAPCTEGSLQQGEYKVGGEHISLVCCQPVVTNEYFCGAFPLDQHEERVNNEGTGECGENGNGDEGAFKEVGAFSH